MIRSDEVTDPPITDQPTLYGRALRFVLVDLIRQHRTVSVAQLVGELTAQGHTLRGRPSKVISDALR